MPASNRKPIDLTGQGFGRLTVLGQAPFSGRKRYPERRWLCVCSCGKTLSIVQHGLTSRHTQSCGCLRREVTSNNHTKHGMVNSPEYHAWQLMKARCFKPQDKSAHNYLERGITVCKGWLDFSTFFKDMGKRPDPKLSLDRVNNNGNYSCGHCAECLENGWIMNARWATRTQQNNNTRQNKTLTLGDKTQTMAEWARELPHIGYSAISQRSRKLGWSDAKVLTTPLRHTSLV